MLVFKPVQKNSTKKKHIQNRTLKNSMDPINTKELISDLKN